MARMGKEEPALGKKPRILDDKCSQQERRCIPERAGHKERNGKGKGEHEKGPLYDAYEIRRPAVEELARVERAAHETLRLLFDAGMFHPDGCLQGGSRSYACIARQCGNPAAQREQREYDSPLHIYLSERRRSNECVCSRKGV